MKDKRPTGQVSPLRAPGELTHEDFMNLMKARKQQITKVLFSAFPELYTPAFLNPTIFHLYIFTYMYFTHMNIFTYM